MKTTSLGFIAASLIGRAPGTAIQASDTRMLAGVGSLTDQAKDTASIITLKGDATTDADTINVYAPLARAGGRAVYGAGRLAAGGVRYAAGYPFYRAWGGYRPWGGWYRPWYGSFRPWGGWYRPWYGFYRPWWGWYRPGLFWNYGVAAAPYYGAAYPAVTCSSPIIPGCACGSAPVPPAVETAPPPQPQDGYQYDGGPARRIPAPGPMTPQTPPVPQPSAVEPIARRPAKKLTYPAYGDKDFSRPVSDPLLVKASRNK